MSVTIPTTIWDINQTERAAFNAAWLASRHPSIQALYSAGMDAASRVSAAEAIALKGLTAAAGASPESVWVDPNIDGAGVEAFYEMWQRLIDGLPWTPSGFMPNIQPGSLEPGETANPPFVPYDPLHPPAQGAITSTIDPSDPSVVAYPVAPPPPTPNPNPPIHVPVPGDVLVGADIAPGFWGLTPLAEQSDLPDGFPWTQNGVAYILHVVSAGMAKVFELATAASSRIRAGVALPDFPAK